MKAVIEPLLTIADLDATPDDGHKYELIEGEIYVSRAPSFDHQVIVSNLLLWFGLYLRAHPIGVAAPGPAVVFDDFDGVIPDLVFVTNERRGKIISEGRVMGHRTWWLRFCPREQQTNNATASSSENCMGGSG